MTTRPIFSFILAMLCLFVFDSPSKSTAQIIQTQQGNQGFANAGFGPNTGYAPNPGFAPNAGAASGFLRNSNVNNGYPSGGYANNGHSRLTGHPLNLVQSSGGYYQSSPNAVPNPGKHHGFQGFQFGRRHRNAQAAYDAMVAPEYVAAHPFGDLMDTRKHSLMDYRRLFVNGVTPTPQELVGYWRGVNKGIVEIAGYRQFIKEITPQNCHLTGDNLMVNQVSIDMLRSVGWQLKEDPESVDGLTRTGKFAIQPPQGIGAFEHGTVFNYADGANQQSDPVRLLVDKVVKVDDNHLVGRVTANFGPVQIPLAYFVLERIGY